MSLSLLFSALVALFSSTPNEIHIFPLTVSHQLTPSEIHIFPLTVSHQVTPSEVHIFPI
jgi:Lon protease-like protein